MCDLEPFSEIWSHITYQNNYIIIVIMICTKYEDKLSLISLLHTYN